MTRQRANFEEKTSTSSMETQNTENGAIEVLRKTIRSLTERDSETPPSDARSLTERDPETPLLGPPLPHCDSDHALIPHLSHLLNAAASCLNVYLSLESLTRRTKEDKLLPRDELNVAMYEQGMSAQANLLRDLDGNIQIVLNRLLQTSLHGRLEDVPSYSSLLDAARMLPDIASELPPASLAKEGSTAVSAIKLPDVDALTALHAKCDELVRLCHGDAAEEIEGWKGCLEAARDKMMGTNA